MTFLIHRFGATVEITAELEALAIRGPRGIARRENWPEEALQTPLGWRTAIEIEQLLEAGLAEEQLDAVLVPYAQFQTIKDEDAGRLIDAWCDHSPFLLKIDRKSDLGRPDFQYQYAFLLAGRPVHIDRLGYYVRRAGSPQVYLLDSQMFSLVEAMDRFNSLPAQAKTVQESWLTFAKVKGCATEVGATLDSTLQKNDVIVPSMLGLDLKEDEDGALSFLPKCEELAREEFHQVFERNSKAEKIYSLDRPGAGKVRIVLTDQQHEVLQRMKRVRRVKGELKERLKLDPAQAFDGLGEYVELPYGERVIGIGEFQFASTPHQGSSESPMAKLWKDVLTTDTPAVTEETSTGGQEAALDRQENEVLESSESGQGPFKEHGDGQGLSDEAGESGASQAEPDSTDPSHRPSRYLLIETNEDSVSAGFLSEAARAGQFSGAGDFERPNALKGERDLRPHQMQGVSWLQTCARVKGRKGVLLADDMGVGKTVQVLTFLAWCIESGNYPDLSRQAPPFRPILIVAPLILVDTRTWEKEMESFFANDGVVFWPVLSLHGGQLARLRRQDADGPEVEIGRPVLDLNQIQRYRVVITNYETLKNYQHSFAYMKDGKPLWSFIVSDEAQEFKIPNTKISHAMKALKADLHIACTGTPVENRLLDLWNICDVLQPGLLSSAREFVDQFEKTQEEIPHDRSLQELKKKLLFQQPHAFLLRRTKSEVADLPPKHISPLPCVMSEQEIGLHQQLLRRLKSESTPTRFLTVLHQFAQLYLHPALLSDDPEDQSAADLIKESSKLRTVLETLHNVRGQREKAILFARHHAMQTILAKVLQAEFQIPVRIINGDTKMRAGGLRPQGVKTRAAILNEFRERHGFNLLILSPFVAGIGLTIVEANHVFHYGRWWNPAVESQATDRAYRIGQTKPVSVYLPILTDPTGQVSPTFDERLDVLMDRKQRLAEDFLKPLLPEDEMGTELFTDLRDEAKRQR